MTTNTTYSIIKMFYIKIMVSKYERNRNNRLRKDCNGTSHQSKGLCWAFACLMECRLYVLWHCPACNQALNLETH